MSENDDFVYTNNIELRNKIEEIIELFNLINNINSKKNKDILTYKFLKEIDFTIDSLETLYYDVAIKRKLNVINNLHKERHDTIMYTKNTLNTFLPYMLTYNILQQESIKASN